MKEKIRLPKSIKKFIRKEKTRIRREILSLEEQQKLVDQLYERFLGEGAEREKEEVKDKKDNKAKKDSKAKKEANSVKPIIQTPQKKSQKEVLSKV